MLPKKKILFIITYLELGGAQKQLLYILRNLNKSEYDIYLYAGNRGRLKRDFLNLSGINIKLDSLLIRNINPLFDVLVFLKLLFFIRKHRFDIIHTHSPKASVLGRWAAYFAGVKNIIYTVHGWPFHKFMSPFLYSFYLFMEKVTAKITKIIIVVSNADLNKGIKNRVALRHKFSLIHYGINIDKFKNIWAQRHNREMSTRRADKRAGRYTVLTVSSLKPQKGIMRFLDAARILLDEMPDLEFIIAGGGPLKDRVKREIKRRGLSKNVFLYGWINDMPKLLEKADIFVLTSLWEGLPIALIEAAAAGLPFVVTNTGGVLDITRSYQGGIVVDSFAPQAIKKACLKILKNHYEWSKIIKDKGECFDAGYWSYKRMAGQVENVYKLI